MRLILHITAGLLALSFVTGCVQAIDPESAVARTVIAEHVRAFNARDIEAMAKMQHPDIQWLSVKGHIVSIEVDGRDALAQNMTKYVKSPTKVTSTLRNWNVNAPYVAVTETAKWTATNGVKKSQSSMTVYELEDNLIRRVWYYPAVDK